MQGEDTVTRNYAVIDHLNICSCYMTILSCTEKACTTLVLIELVSLFNIWNSTFETAIMLDNCVNYLYVLINHDYLWSLLVRCFLHCSAWRWTCSARSFPPSWKGFCRQAGSCWVQRSNHQVYRKSFPWDGSMRGDCSDRLHGDSLASPPTHIDMVFLQPCSQNKYRVQFV